MRDKSGLIVSTPVTAWAAWAHFHIVVRATCRPPHRPLLAAVFGPITEWKCALPLLAFPPQRVSERATWPYIEVTGRDEVFNAVIDLHPDGLKACGSQIVFANSLIQVAAHRLRGNI